jgi:UDP-N-acetylglucosamine 2-epimerase (non-hydrolysing)
MISIIVGTRPEIIKMSPIIRECQRRNIDFSLLHTGQHYSHEMDRIFFEELNLPVPDHHLDVGSGSHADQTGAIMSGIGRVYEEGRPDVVLVQGDTNTVLAGSLVADHVADWGNPFGAGKEGSEYVFISMCNKHPIGRYLS